MHYRNIPGHQVAAHRRCAAFDPGLACLAGRVSRRTVDYAGQPRDQGDPGAQSGCKRGVMPARKGSWDAQWRFVQSLRRRAFDCVIDLTDGDRSAVISSRPARPCGRFNAEHRWRGLLYRAVATPRPTEQHRVEYDLCALRHLGLDPKPGTPVLHVSQAENAVVETWLQEAGLALLAGTPPLLCCNQARVTP